jgi:hypothetical protein
MAAGFASGRAVRPQGAAMVDLNNKIARMEERLKKLKSRQIRIDARRRHLESRRSRREETRRKILVGAVVLAKVERGELEESVLRGWLEPALERDEDRALFELPKSSRGATK